MGEIDHYLKLNTLRNNFIKNKTVADNKSKNGEGVMDSKMTKT
jgi:hypothetical protein